MGCFEEALQEVAPTVYDEVDIPSYEAIIIPETGSPANSEKRLIDATVGSIIAGGQDFANEDVTVSTADIKTGNIAVQREDVLPSDTMFTSQQEPDVSTPSMSEDYPNSETIYVDEKGTWIKNNKAKGTLDFVHRSGSSLSFKKDGSVIMFVRKDFKQVVDGDYTLEVGNNLDISSGNDMRLHSVGAMSIEPDTMLTVLTPLMVIKAGLLLENP